MLVTPQSDQRNRRFAFGLAVVAAIVIAVLCTFSVAWLIAAPLCGLIYYLVRRSTLRRQQLIASTFPATWETALEQYVGFYRALDDSGKQRFQNMVKVFLDEVPITGIRTEVDDPTRALVAASAVIPVFGFDDWEYSGLGEILIYPNAFDSDYRTGEHVDRNTLGMIGVGHLSGVMILSKPDLFAGFSQPEDKRNVGIHEFAHLVDKADGSVDGVPAGIPHETIKPWIDWIGQELQSQSPPSRHINDYAFTNEAEYFAVLSEYFFEAPDLLEKKNPQLYRMLQSIYRQDAKTFLSSTRRRPRRIGRNSPCPCGSGQKFKRCCRRNRGNRAPKV